MNPAWRQGKDKGLSSPIKVLGLLTKKQILKSQGFSTFTIQIYRSEGF
jgi:hypothetical protein